MLKLYSDLAEISVSVCCCEHRAKAGLEWAGNVHESFPAAHGLSLEGALVRGVPASTGFST